MYKLLDIQEIKRTLEDLNDRVGKPEFSTRVSIQEWLGDVENEIWRSEMNEEFGIRVTDYYGNRDYTRLDEFRFIATYGPGIIREIAWPDDDVQPDNEVLLCISFSSGPYIFGKSGTVSKEFFQRLLSEILAFNPDYKDTINHSFYWKLENARDVNEAFPSILAKYRKLNVEDRELREAERLEQKAKELRAKYKEML